MAQVNVKPPARSAPPPAPDDRRSTRPFAEPDARTVLRAVDPGPMALDAGRARDMADRCMGSLEGRQADSMATTATFTGLDPTDASAWESVWMPAPLTCQPTEGGGLRFELELRSWGRLEIGCAPLHPRGWHVAIASDDANVRRRLRAESGRLRDALRQLAGHDDMTLEIDA